MITVDDTIRRVDYRRYECKNGFHLVIRSETSSWCLSTDESEMILRGLPKEDTPIKRVCEELGISFEMLKPIFDGFRESGFVAINGKLRTFAASNPHKLSSLLLRLTNSCNLACSYCYIDSDTYSNKTEFMDTKTAYKSIELFLRSTKVKKVNIVLSGGEPLLIGTKWILDIFDYAHEIGMRYGKDVVLSLQTNGTLLDQVASRELAMRGVRLSVSLDVCKESHNKNRYHKNKEGSFGQVLKNLKTVQKEYEIHGENKAINIFCVITNDLIKAKESVLRVFASDFLECNWHFEPLREIGRGKETRLRASSRKEFEFMKCLFETGISLGKLIDPVRFLIQNIVSASQSCLCYEYPCGGGTIMLSIEPNGDIYPCDALKNDEKFLLGNVHTLNSYLQIERTISNVMQDVWREMTRRSCKECLWRGFCPRGCSIGRNGRLKPPLCDLCKLFIPYLMVKIVEDPRICEILTHV
jgi:uncharacterized protein